MTIFYFIFAGIFLFNAIRHLRSNDLRFNAAYEKVCSALQSKNLDVISRHEAGMDTFVRNCHKLEKLLHDYPEVISELRLVRKHWIRGSLLVFASAFGALAAAAVLKTLVLSKV